MTAFNPPPNQPPSPSSSPAAWYADPLGRHELRYYDGAQWTEHVSSHRRTSVDPPVGQGHIQTVQRAPERVQQDVHRAGAAGVAAFQGGTGSIFTEPILVVNQKAKLIEINNEYAIYDQNARQIAAVRETGQSGLKKAARFLTSLDQYMTHKLQIVDMQGNVLLALTRPAKLVKSRIIVENAQAQEIGQIVQQNAIGKIRFSLEAGGNVYGSINGENWRAWNFNIQDHAGTEVARITKTWEGLAKTMFTTADNYVLQIHRPLEDPLRTLVVAAALGVDTALKQDSRGFG
ncbi:MAG: phospholipid scramblase-related protein [Gaiellales bacterium]